MMEINEITFLLGDRKMKIIIDIPEGLYNNIQKGCGIYPYRQVYEAIANGTPLPKGCDIQRIVPKRVDVQKWIHTECPNPNCNYILSTHHGDGYYTIEDKPSFCPKCGQALLWESEE